MNLSRTDSVRLLWRNIGKARELLEAGVPVALPTETVYGLAAPIDRPDAIERIFRIKERPFFDPLIVHVSGLEEVPALVREFPAEARILAEHFWPGPLTLVLPRNSSVDSKICAGLDTVAIRCPEHPVFRRLIRELGVPLAAPSANKFAKTSPTRAEHVRRSWSEDEVFVVDGGPSDVGIESTVVQVGRKDGQLTLNILRPGMIGRDKLSSVLPQALVIRETSSASPGHLEEHYQPRLPLVFVTEELWREKERLLECIAERLRVAANAFSKLELPREAVLAARMLYDFLLKNHGENVQFLLFVQTRDMEIDEGWTAILDRLRRASSLRIVSFDQAS